MGSLLCPVLIGRDEPRDALREHLGAAAAGQGRVVALMAEAGMGKSRLAREVIAEASAKGMAVLCGRAVPGVSPTPLRPVTEALLVADRTGGLTGAAELSGFGGQIARLIPGPAGEVQVSDSSPLLLWEAVVRLLRVAGHENGCLLLLEDLHWADPETLDIVEYLADTLTSERVLCVITSRDEPGPAARLLARLQDRGAVPVHRLGALSAEAQRQMITACLDDAVLPAEIADFVAAHSDGIPFLVEELLAGLVSSGALEYTEVGWRAVGRLLPSVPVSFAETVGARLTALGPSVRNVLGAAAVLGRRFEWELLPGVAGVDGTAAIEAMRAAIGEQLVLVEGPDFRFRHALTREAVLTQLLPPERATFSRRALDGVRRAHPSLPGDRCELAAELAEAAGAAEAAAALWIESARRSVRRGVLASAAATAERAGQLATEPGTRADAQEVLVEALVLAGDITRAERVGSALLPALAELDQPARRAVGLHLVLARAAIAAGDGLSAQQHVDAARALPLEVVDRPTMTARLDAVHAHVAMDAERPDEAKRLAQAALTRAEQDGLPEVECEALEVLGRLGGDLATSRDFFGRAMAIAERHGLVAWRLRALQEIVLRETELHGSEPLVEARRIAAEAGSLIMVTQLDLLIAEIAFGSFDRAGALEVAQRCVQESRRFGLATLPVALLWLAGAHALADDETSMERVLAEARELDPSDERIAADSWGRVRAVLCAVREDRAGLRAALDASMPHVRAAPPSRSLFLGQALWAMLHTMDDDDQGDAARAELAASSALMSFVGGRAGLACAEAVALGRRGRKAEAERTYADVLDLIGGVRARAIFMGGYLDRLVAEAAIRDGWGEPAEWLRPVEAFYATTGYDRLARACRALMAAAGASAPRRGRGDSSVPASLRALGVTSRELDVLTLVHDGLGNREIAERLHLSPRTVENHVASLLRRTGAATRADLPAPN